MTLDVIVNAIPTGERNAISMATLRDVSRCANERELRRCIEHLRTNSEIIICSSDKGYYRPENMQELFKYYNRTHKRAMTNLMSLKHARRILKENGALWHDTYTQRTS